MSEASAVNGTSNTMCKPTIDLTTYELGCLGPALAIIVVLSCLKRRSKLKLEYCHGYPGLLIPVNFLRSFSYSNRFTIAATFGATANSCLGLFFSLSPVAFVFPSVPGWLNVFVKIFSVLVYGILFYPFFACLTTEYKLVGSSLGFLYAAIRFCFDLGIYFQCESHNKGERRNLLYIDLLSFLPTILCLLFITLRFAVLLILQVRRKWFLTINGYQERAVKTSEMCLVAEPVIKHVKQILTPGLNRDVADAKWYIKLLHFIYKPREDFKFSTQLVSTLVVAAIIVFQIFVASLYVFDVVKKKYADLPVVKDLFFDLFGMWQAALVLSAMISAILLLHFMKSHRNHVLQLYRGQRRFAQGVFPSPPGLVLGSLRFSGYQVAYTIYGRSSNISLFKLSSI
ncbi:hypothetical protein ABFA07_020516 [Porites harrisoni]